MICKYPILLCPISLDLILTVKSKAHILCICKREIKIPVIEEPFVKAQREKTGSIGALMISSQDIPESKRQKDATQRKKRGRISEERRLEKAKTERKKADDWNQAD